MTATFVPIGLRAVAFDELDSVYTQGTQRVIIGCRCRHLHLKSINHQSISGIYSAGWGARCVGHPGLKAQVNIVGDKRCLVSIALQKEANAALIGTREYAAA